MNLVTLRECLCRRDLYPDCGGNRFPLLTEKLCDVLMIWVLGRNNSYGIVIFIMACLYELEQPVFPVTFLFPHPGAAEGLPPRRLCHRRRGGGHDDVTVTWARPTVQPRHSSAGEYSLKKSTDILCAGACS